MALPKAKGSTTMTEPNLNILGQLEGEWRDLCSGIRREKLEELFMQVTAATMQKSYTLTDMERSEALAIHDQTERDFLASIEGLSQAQWTFRPGPNRWSVQETAEHIVLVEAFLAPALQQTLAQEPDAVLEEKVSDRLGYVNFASSWEAMKVRVLDRSARGIDAPPPMVPKGQWSLAETQRRYREAHATIRELLTRPNLDLKAHIFTGGPGTFTCDHWLTLVSLHTRRHLGQITETKMTGASEGFPK
jgi:uncharacterized damage-inducible protein DinB